MEEEDEVAVKKGIILLLLLLFLPEVRRAFAFPCGGGEVVASGLGYGVEVVMVVTGMGRGRLTHGGDHTGGMVGGEGQAGGGVHGRGRAQHVA